MHRALHPIGPSASDRHPRWQPRRETWRDGIHQDRVCVVEQILRIMNVFIEHFGAQAPVEFQ
jgi:hypothetical protein